MSELKEQAPFKKRWALMPREKVADFLARAAVIDGMLLALLIACYAVDGFNVVTQRMCIVLFVALTSDVMFLLGLYLRRVPAD